MHLINPVMTYAWGSYRAIAELLGEPSPAKEPQAELWMGAHPKAPSMVEIAGSRQRLDELIRDYPQEILGHSVAVEYLNRLPFLFKVLAARHPLSIQAHPDAIQAKAGFARENALGIPLNAAERNYRDAHHKPECICALGEFWALCGFRPTVEIADLLETICPAGLAADLKLLRRQSGDDPLQPFLRKLMRLDNAQRTGLISEARAYAKKMSGVADDDAPARWIDRIAADFPEDIGVLAPALMNVVRLKAGEALFLPAGCLHAYLSGTGIELMANSDNVLRGGLTRKHVNVDELLTALKFDAWRPEVIRPLRLGPAESYYPCAAREFQLSMLAVAPDQAYRSPAQRNVEILLCTRGRGQIAPTCAPTDAMDIRKGTCILVPAAAPAYQINGNALLYRAGVPR